MPPTIRRRMARRLGFGTVAAFESWEDEVVIDHFANFICDYLARGYTIVPERRGFVEFVDLETAVAARIAMLEERRFEFALDPDKAEWTAKDHYKQFIVGVVADDKWLAQYGCEGAEIVWRGWTPKETVIKMFKLLEFLRKEWDDGPGDSAYQEKVRGG
ncbi:hypothetical protein BT67DRAFT_443618 [Trichocladium antarcticum]|uniref:Uncharacterized protein n=1 Tax=Trichocladium antarcticum TaxID=1450529 RepID=A0AAN6ZCG1_9PEZI|nr:hypothetical protein BT67DRAFT_443618 [Trichocladium antarcticum]